jgi:hypothetical protein
VLTVLNCPHKHLTTSPSSSEDEPMALLSGAHGHDVCTEPEVASTWIQIRVLSPCFLRLGTSRPPEKERPMDPRCGAYGKEGEDTMAVWDGYTWWRTPPPPSLVRMCARQVLGSVSKQ